MNTDLALLAVDMAIKNNWEEAIKLNLQILEEVDDDIEALNRLSRAYFETGDLSNAKKITNKVLSLDSANQIALRALQKYSQSKKVKIKNGFTNIDPSIFIEEPGKTKIVSLVNTGSKDVCLCLNCGEEVKIITYTHKLSVVNTTDKYIGKLPDDVSAKLKIFIKGGNKYKAFIKSVDGKSVKVLIKEVSKATKYKNVPSFPKSKSESISEQPTDLD